MKKEMDPELYRIRHSMAHVLAQAVIEIRPEAQLGIGPPIDSGFYYDFYLDSPINPEDFKDLEKRMKKIIKDDQAFQYEELSGDEAVAKLESVKQSFKVELCQEFIERGDTISFYQNGPFNDLCEGPHVASTAELKQVAFKVDSTAGAYWRGDEKRPMMQRIYCLCFATKDELKAFEEKRRLALQRDHRKLNKDMHLFAIVDEVGKGLPLWLPHGTAIRDALEDFAREVEFKAGYKRVATPHITNGKLYEISGHLPYYKDSMFPPMTTDGEELYLKPMNCPHHHMIYKAQPHSYRDLPLRLAEYGQVYRYEQHGELAGLLRVRGMAMNDAHIYCTLEQLEEEFAAVMTMHEEYYQTFGFDSSKYYIRFSKHDPGSDKFVGDAEMWQQAEEMMQRAMDQLGIQYVAETGEAAFYGPKADFQIENVIGREETASTNQVDFLMGKRFELEYMGSDGVAHTPVIIHRAPLGTHERFISFLIEHYGGAFPTWLAPVQAVVLSVNPENAEYCQKVSQMLSSQMVRVECDVSGESLGKKIRNAAKLKVPNVVICGSEEMASDEVTVRRHGSRDQRRLKLTAFIDDLQSEIKQRIDWRQSET